MADLGNLFFSLGIKTEGAESSLEKVQKSIEGIVQGTKKTETSFKDANKQVEQTKRLLTTITSEDKMCGANRIRKYSEEVRKVFDEFSKRNANYSNWLNIPEANEELAKMNNYYRELEAEQRRIAEEANRIPESIRRSQEAAERYANVAKGIPNIFLRAGGSNPEEILNSGRIEAYNRALNAQNTTWGSILSKVKSYVFMLTGGNIINSLIRITGEFEYQRTALQNIIQDATKANQIFAELKNLALESPFRMTELVTFTKQLSAFSIPKNELYDTVKMLGDISTGLGVSMDRLILAYGQIRSASFLRGQEVRQLTEAGLPILDELAKQFKNVEGSAISAGEVFEKISRRQVSFSMVEEVFKNLTKEGGKFYEMQQKQTDTLKGQVLKLKDTWELTLADVGERNNGMIKGVISLLSKALENIQKIGGGLAGIVVASQAMKVSMSLWVTFFAKSVSDTAVLNANIVKMSVNIKKMTNTIKANPWIAIASAILGIITYIRIATAETRNFQKELDKINSTHLNTVEKSIKNLDVLRKNLESATKGSDNYRNAINEINDKYGEYLPNLLKESDAVQQLAKDYDAVTAAIRNKEKARAIEDLQTKIDEKYNGYVSKASTNQNIERISGGLYDKNTIYTVYQKAIDDVSAKFKKTTEEIKRNWEESAKGGNQEIYRAIITSISNQLDTRFTEASKLQKDVKGYIDYLANYERDMNEALKKADIIGGNYQSVEHYNAIKRVEQAYKDEKQAIADMVSTGDNAEAYLKAEIKYWEELIKVANEFGDIDLLNKANEAKARLTAVGSEFEQIIKRYNDKLNLNFQSGIKSLNEYYTEWIDRYEQAQKDYSWALQQGRKDDAVAIKNEINLLNELFKELKLGEGGKDFTAIYNGNKGTESAKKETEAQKELYEQLKRRYDIVKKLQSAYETLKAVSSQDAINSVYDAINAKAENIIDNETMALIKSGDFEAALLKIAEAAKAINSEKGDGLFNDIIDENAMIQFDQIVDKAEKAGKALKDLQERYDSFISDQLEYAPGMKGKIYKVLNQYNKDINDAMTRRNTGIEQSHELFNAGDIKGYVKWIEEVMRMYNVELEKAKEKAQATLTDLAQTAFSDYKTDSGITERLQNQARMSYKEYTDLAEAIRNSSDSTMQMVLSDEQLVESMALAGISIDDLIKKVKELANAEADALEDKGKVRLFKNISKAADITADALSKLSNAFADIGNNDVVNALNKVQYGIEAIGTYASIAAKVAEEDIAGAVAEGVSFIMASITKLIKKQYNFRSAVEDTKRAIKEMKEAYKDDSFNSIFGEDSLGRLDYYIKRIKELNKEMYSIRNGKIFQEVSYNDLLKSFVIGQGKYKINISDFIDWDIPIAQQIKAILDDDKFNLTDYQEKVLKNIYEYYTALESATDSITDYMTDKFSQVGDNLAESLMEAFQNGEDFAESFESSMSDISQSIIKDILKAAYITPSLQTAIEKINALQARDTNASVEDYLMEVMNIARNAIGEIADNEEGIREFLESMQEYLGDTTSSGGLSSDIKGITEDTAQLLASYINGIRADVSVQREAIISSIVPSIENINYIINLGLSEVRAINENTLRSANNTETIKGLLSLAQGSNGAIKVDIVN